MDALHEYHDEPAPHPVPNMLAQHVGAEALRYDGDAFYVVVVGRNGERYTLYLTNEGQVTTL